MSDKARPGFGAEEIEALLRQNQHLLRQNAELLDRLDKFLKQREVAEEQSPAARPDDDQEFFLGL